MSGWRMRCWLRCLLPLLRCWRRWALRALNRTWQPPSALVFVLVMAWTIAAGKGKLSQVRHVDVRELGFLVASGIATGASWLFFYYAISAGQVSVVVQIDKLSILVSIAFAWIVFGERLTPKSGVGLALIVAGTLAMSIWI